MRRAGRMRAKPTAAGNGRRAKPNICARRSNGWNPTIAKAREELRTTARAVRPAGRSGRRRGAACAANWPPRRPTWRGCATKLRRGGDGRSRKRNSPPCRPSGSNCNGELETLRHRAAELSEALAEQKRQADAERDRWSEELRHMRQVLERQTRCLDAARRAGVGRCRGPGRHPRAAGRRPRPRSRKARERLQHPIRAKRTVPRRDRAAGIAARGGPRGAGPAARSVWAAGGNGRRGGPAARASCPPRRRRSSGCATQVASPAEAAELQEQLCTMQNERQQLQGELEVARRRAADLTEALDEQKRLAAAEREAMERGAAARPRSARSADRGLGRARRSDCRRCRRAGRRPRAGHAGRGAKSRRAASRLQMQLEQNEQLREEIQPARGPPRDRPRRAGATARAVCSVGGKRRRSGPAARRTVGRTGRNRTAAIAGRQSGRSGRAAAATVRQPDRTPATARRAGSDCASAPTDLTEQLAEQQRQAAAEREAWSEELRHLRETLERQSETWAARAGQPADERHRRRAGRGRGRLADAEAELARSQERLQAQTATERATSQQEIEQIAGQPAGRRRGAGTTARRAGAAGEDAAEAEQLRAELEAATQAEIAPTDRATEPGTRRCGRSKQRVADAESRTAATGKRAGPAAASRRRADRTAGRAEADRRRGARELERGAAAVAQSRGNAIRGVGPARAAPSPAYSAPVSPPPSADPAAVPRPRAARAGGQRARLGDGAV